ncbi:MAG: tetratricopeptide repeat protein, partial [Candidatus Binatia bacterium]
VGKQMEQAGVGLGQLFALRRLRAALDTALELAPHDADVLAAKGAMLLRLPRLLGGDVEEAERLLRAAVEADPTNNEARCYLSRALAARGHGEEARALQPSC